jgi:hypothetical protein
LSSLREVAIVLFKGDCSQNIPSRGTPHDNREQLCLSVAMADADLSGANSSRKGHSIQRVVLPGFDHFWPKPAASTVTFELAQTGGISSCNKATQIEQPAESCFVCLLSVLLPVRQRLSDEYNTFGLGGG